MSQKKALIAMSGGVDSSVAAFLMQRSGYACGGAIMELWGDQSGNIEDARSVAGRLDIPFYVLDNTAIFRAHVVDSFIRCYEEGGTPNPCIACNRHLKFGAFLDQALALGYEYIATGHYAQIKKSGDRFLLCRAADKAKDQTYFLASLTQQQLKHVRFPLGELTKNQIRQIAEEQGFITAKKRDSQDICFIPDGDYKAFMEAYTQKQYPAGDYLDLQGNVVGKHTGAVGYTIGQRKGLGIAMGQPVYVCDKDMAQNTVTLGPNEALFRKELLAKDWNWIAIDAPAQPIRVTAKVRYRHTEQPATVYPEADGTARVVFDEPQRAITTGQAVVLYDGDTVIGSATIQKVL